MADESFLDDLGQSLEGAGRVARTATIASIEAISYLAVPIVMIGLAATISVFLVRLPGRLMRNE
jgi:hypothetical protein